MNIPMVTFLNNDDVPVRARLLNLTQKTAVFEIYNPCPMIQINRVLKNIYIFSETGKIYDGSGFTKELIPTGSTTVCSVRLMDPLLQIEQDLTRHIDFFLNGFKNILPVRSSFESVVNKIRIFLERLDQVLKRVDSFFDAYTAKRKADLQKKFIMGPCEPLVRKIEELFNEFTVQASSIPEQEKELHKDFAREVLHPLLLSIPFLYRAFTKPLGYTGDYEVVDMMLRPYELEGKNTYSKIINLALLKQPAARAHRNRIDILVDKLKVEAEKATKVNKILRVMSVGCGPATEIQRFIREHAVAENCEFFLVDFNQETIEHVQKKIREAKMYSKRSPDVHFIQESVTGLLKDKTERAYNFIYCTGLFDYLSDNICKRLTRYFYNWLEPDGILILSNVHSRNPDRCLMEFFAEWNLIYRNTKDMTDFAFGLSSSYRLFTDKTKINLFLEIRS